MLPSERFIRHRVIREHLGWIEDMLAAAAMGLDSAKDADELAHLQHAARHLIHAADALKDAEAEASVSIAPDLLAEQLRASIELIGRSPERMRQLQEEPCSRCGYCECICPLQEE